MIERREIERGDMQELNRATAWIKCGYCGAVGKATTIVSDELLADIS